MSVTDPLAQNSANNIRYATGTHHVAPVEMPSMPSMSQGPASPRRSTDKPGGAGVERYG